MAFKPVFLKKKINLYFFISVLSAIIPAVLIMLIPFVGLEGSAIQKAGAYITAAAFWLCIIFELWMMRLCSLERKGLEGRKEINESLAQAYPGVISFMKTREGLFADVIMAVAFIVVIVIVCIRVKNQWLILSCASILYLSFNAHCLLNGKNYRYIKLISNYKKEQNKDE